MAFNSAFTAEPNYIGAGTTMEAYSYDALNASTFEDGLVVGRFAKLDTGSLDNLDASATPVIAGVVRRQASNPIEDGNTITANVDGGRPVDVSYVRNGYVTVEVDSADSPAFGGAVYAENQTPADYGKATTVSTGNVDVNGEFIEEVNTNVWLIRLK